MTIELRKYHLIEAIMAINDEALIIKHEELLRKNRIAAYEASLKPMTVEAFREEIDLAEKDVEEGRLIDVEDLQKEMKNW
ncbi:MAG TPA: hypothetical protein ENJ95_14500 [Bacteroidetes bacterium]|nr:hypothetical protein [Bacteroidota bacterium]